MSSVIKEVLLGGNGLKEYRTLCSILSNAEFSYIHSESDSYNEIESSLNLQEKDIVLKSLLNTMTESESFCSSAFFLRGCISIMNKSHDLI